MSAPRRWIAAAAVIVATILTAVTARPMPTASAQSPGIYIALGDSVAAGVGSSLPRTRSYPAIVQRRLSAWSGRPMMFENLAVPGETVASFVSGGQLEHFDSTVNQARAGGIAVIAVSLTLGGNEMLSAASSGISDRQAALDAFTREFDDALGRVRDVLGVDVPIVVTTYYDPTGGDGAAQYSDSWWIDQFNAAIRVSATRRQAIVADVQQAFAGRAQGLTRFPDDPHPTNAGHELIADVVWSALGIDTSPPRVEIDSPASASSRTPTFRLRVTDDVSVETVTIEASAGSASRLVPLEADVDGRSGVWVALLDVSDTDQATVTVVVEAVDSAGNRTRHAQEIQLPLAGEDTP